MVLVIIDGLGADEARLPYLDELRARGVAAIARVSYPSISRPSYVTILTGVPPRDSGVRTNRVHAPVAVDSMMDRAQAAGLRVATASDYGSLSSLFLRGARPIADLGSIDWHEVGSRVTPPAPYTWPVDEARRAASLDELAPILAELARSDAAFIPVLVLDVDRAGHAAGVGAEYRVAAARVDRMLREAFAAIDLSRDTVIVTADHGHVAPGGHGGLEPEVTRVPLVLAGAGIVPGAVAHDARSIDIAPTVAALLGVPAPRDAEGRTLVELLRLAPDAAARRLAADDARVRAVTAIADAARAADVRPEAWRLAALGALLAFAGAVGNWLRGRGVLAIPRGALAGSLALVTMLLAMGGVTRGHLSPSYIPSLARTETLVAVGVAISLVLQVSASWLAIGRARDRVVAANGLAAVGLALALGSVALVRAWFSPPLLDVPGPTWMVAIPALDLAAATCALGTALTLLLALARDRLSRRSARRSRARP